MVKCAVIGASKEAIPMIKIAKSKGLFVIGIDGNEDAEGLQYVDKKIVADIRDKEYIVEILKKENIAFLIPVPVGRILTTIGYVNDELNLPGISYTASKICTDKYSFSKILSENKLRNVKSEILDKEINIDSFRFPVIIKPRYGSGSKNVKILNSKDEYIRYIDSNSIDDELIIEELFSGEEYGVDGAIINDKSYITLLRKKEVTKPPYRQEIGYFNVCNLELYKNISNFMDKVKNCIGMNNCLINADVIINGNEIFVVELTGRPAGHSINNQLLQLSTEINLVEEFVKYCLKNTFNFIPKKIHLLKECFFDFENMIVEQIPDKNIMLNKFKWLKYYECNIEKDSFLEPIVDGNSIMWRGYFIVEGNSTEELNERERIIKDLFKIEKFRT